MLTQFLKKLGIKYLRRNNMKWVSVNKKLPEWYEWVFVYSEGVIK